MVFSFTSQPTLAKGQCVVIDYVEGTRRVRAAERGERPMGIIVSDASSGHVQVTLNGSYGGTWTPPAAIPAPRLVPQETCCHYCGGERWQHSVCYYCGTEKQ